MRHRPRPRRHGRRIGAGVCRFCGCSEHDPCVVGVKTDAGTIPIGCAWTDATFTVCTECAPAAKAEAVLFEQGDAKWMRDKGRPLSLRERGTFRRGFIVGWFDLGRAINRNPYNKTRAARWSNLWKIARECGYVARNAHLKAGNRITNAPRAFIL